MSLTQEERTIMVQLEMERADRLIAELPIYIEHEMWASMANRMYYAAFHAATALLIKNSLHAGTHQGVYVLLNRYFIKENILSPEEGRFFSRLETMREMGDYNCYVDTSREDVLPLVESLKAFVNHIHELLA